MKRTRKIISFLMVMAIMCVSLTGIASASSNEIVIIENNGTEIKTRSNGIIYGERVLSTQENDAYLNNLSAEELKIIAEKTAAAEESARQWETQQANKSPLMRSGSLVTVPGTFSMYQQVEDQYCVPATARSIIQYINGSSDTQPVIAKAMGTSLITGTDPQELATYLRSKQSVCHYIYSAYSSQSTMLSNIWHDVVTMKVPASIGISGATTSNWHYATGGHSLVVHGIQDDKSEIRIGDPIGGYNGNAHPTFYNKTAAQASNVCSRIVW